MNFNDFLFCGPIFVQKRHLPPISEATNTFSFFFLRGASFGTGVSGPGLSRLVNVTLGLCIGGSHWSTCRLFPKKQPYVRIWLAKKKERERERETERERDRDRERERERKIERERETRSRRGGKRGGATTTAEGEEEGKQAEEGRRRRRTSEKQRSS